MVPVSAQDTLAKECFNLSSFTSCLLKKHLKKSSEILCLPCSTVTSQTVIDIKRGGIRVGYLKYSRTFHFPEFNSVSILFESDFSL